MIVTIKTNITPVIQFDTDNPAKAKGVTGLIQPSVTVDGIPVLKTFHYAPKGEPVPGLGMFLTIITAVTLLYGLLRLTND